MTVKYNQATKDGATETEGSNYGAKLNYGCYDTYRFNMVKNNW